jgi:hypothetical protein
LVYSGYFTDFNDNIVTKAISLKTILGFLTSKATHHVQLLDVAVLNPRKKIFDQRTIESAIGLISKEDMIEVFFIAWTKEIQAKKKNILSGNEVSEIWALNFTTMQARLKLF